MRTPQARARPRPRRDLGHLHRLCDLLEHSHATRLVVGERLRLGVQRARVHPDALGTHRPPLSDRLAEAPATQLPAEERTHHAEVRDLDVTLDGAVELEKARRRAFGVHDPDFDTVETEPFEPLVVRPAQPVEPVPVAAGRGVEEPAELGRGLQRLAQLHRLWRRRRRLELRRVLRLQAPRRDVDEHAGSIARARVTMTRCASTATPTCPDVSTSIASSTSAWRTRCRTAGARTSTSSPSGVAMRGP